MLRTALSISLSFGILSTLSGAAFAAPIKVSTPGQARVAPPQIQVDARGARLQKLSTDPWTNTTSEHKTEVEPDIASNGSTIVATFQQGRFNDGGASDIGWATSTNGGTTWQHGFLPGITKIQNPSNAYDRDTDPAVVYDAKHGMWLISSLPLIDVSGGIGQMPLVNASNDGIHWGNPVAVAKNNGDFMDKSWITCDNWTTSPNYGHCYVEWDDVYQGDYEMMSTSSDGGKTWSTPFAPNEFGLGGVPQALQNGTAVVPYTDGYSNILAFSSTDGGKTWGNNVVISPINWHGTSGQVRTEPLPSSTIDGSGRIYVAWQDCSFRQSCAENDIVMSSSTDGVHWTAEQRIPIDPVNSTVDHFEPGLGADITTGGTSAHLGLTYYYFPQTNCSLSTCQLFVGYVSSQDGGQTWSAPTALTKAMNVTWTANTDQGYMTGDYIATAFSGGMAHGVFAVSKKLNGSVYNEYMATTKAGLPMAQGMMRFSSRGERPIPGAHSSNAHWYPPYLTEADSDSGGD